MGLMLLGFEVSGYHLAQGGSDALHHFVEIRLTHCRLHCGSHSFPCFGIIAAIKQRQISLAGFERNGGSVVTARGRRTGRDLLATAHDRYGQQCAG